MRGIPSVGNIVWIRPAPVLAGSPDGREVGMLASYGMLPLIWSIAWLEHGSSSRRRQHDVIVAGVPADGS